MSTWHVVIVVYTNMDIFKELILKYNDENVLISPVSILSTLSILHHGAAGSTAEQLSKYIENVNENVSEDKDDNNDDMDVDIPYCATLATANKIYGSDSIEFHASFLQKIKDDFQTVNFNNANQTKELINEWVKTMTNGKINSLLTSPLPINTRMAVVSAVHFKAMWKYPFSKHLTYTDKFYISKNIVTSVDMMVSTENDLQYVHINELFGGFSIIDIPYEGNSSMVIILPDDIEGIYNIEKNITDENFKKWCGMLSTKSIDLYMPKFKVEMTEPYNLVPILENLGLTNIFGYYADFSKMCNETITVENFLHTTFIDVNEEYTEASAVTGVFMTNFSMVYRTKVYINHPFMYMIKDNTGRILFIGKYCYPQ
ncbi:SPI-1 [Ectromelia virus]|uniref:SPI-1 n=5 Tax=Ectromelia virus TaxID=12643 RepID=A0A8D9CIK0_9POXV|nr:serpin C14R [Ectromelia virus]AFH54738.1 serpin [Ectromelia virus ERPV]AIF30253.1 EVN197 [Ectromelia virus Naval]QSV39762.1 Serpin [Ectromelia virus WH]AAC99573.1 serpin C14R [Ectromelia virus]AUO16331.1 SPI-1 [Ectromelia virus]